MATNLSRPVGHPPLRGEGPGDQRGHLALAPLFFVGEGPGEVGLLLAREADDPLVIGDALGGV